MDTPISTVARRIQREVTETSPEAYTFLSAEGHGLDGHPVGTWMKWPEGAILEIPGGRITQREAQDWLDGWQASIEHGEDWEYFSIGDYVWEVAEARELAKTLREERGL